MRVSSAQAVLDPPTFSPLEMAEEMEVDQTPSAGGTRFVPLLSSLIQTRSIELVLAPIASQVAIDVYTEIQNSETLSRPRRAGVAADDTDRDVSRESIPGPGVQRPLGDGRCPAHGGRGKENYC